MGRCWKTIVACIACCLTVSAVGGHVAGDGELVDNGSLQRRTSDGRAAVGFAAAGGVEYRPLLDPRRDAASWDYALRSDRPAGELSCDMTGVDANAGRWFRLTVRGLPQDRFAVADLHLSIAFFGQHGRVAYDAKAKPILPQVLAARRDLAVNGDRHVAGAEAWQTYRLDFALPFPQVDQVRVGIGFTGGTATGPRDAAFLVDEVSLVRIPDPPGLPAPAERPTAVISTAGLIAIGGRWYYQPRPGETAAPPLFDAANVDRLLYRDDVYSAPFAGNTTAWLRSGDLDLHGQLVTRDRLVVDNVTLSFTADALVVHTHGLPNHPTGRFPEQGFGNPSHITERLATYYVPLVPRENPNRTVVDTDNINHALPMGPIGVAVNGVVFFNPFDADSEDATDLMDRCCGHPNPDGQYHYHKYPICVNSPWADVGDGHSPLIGWAFDGFPLYGPYRSRDVMAKNVTGPAARNAFNGIADPDRGWHYEVTPGKFPYLIGGFWGVEDPRNQQRPRRPRGNRQPPPPPPDRG